MNNESFSFDLVDKYTPDVVIKKLLKQIEEATNGFVIGEIEEYDGSVESYKKQTGLAAALSSLESSETIQVNIQEDLGVQNVSHHKFEVFLSVKHLEYYKYRIMFIDYTDISYPVKVVLNEELAIAYSGKNIYQFVINTMSELEKMFNDILNLDIIIALIQSLINESLRQEMKVQNQ